MVMSGSAVELVPKPGPTTPKIVTKSLYNGRRRQRGRQCPRLL